jgi:hypothetical protein
VIVERIAPETAQGGIHEDLKLLEALERYLEVHLHGFSIMRNHIAEGVPCVDDARDAPNRVDGAPKSSSSQVLLATTTFELRDQAWIRDSRT